MSGDVARRATRDDTADMDTNHPTEGTSCKAIRSADACANRTAALASAAQPSARETESAAKLARASVASDVMLPTTLILLADQPSAAGRIARYLGTVEPAPATAEPASITASPCASARALADRIQSDNGNR